MVRFPHRVAALFLVALLCGGGLVDVAPAADALFLSAGQVTNATQVGSPVLLTFKNTDGSARTIDLVTTYVDNASMTSVDLRSDATAAYWAQFNRTWIDGKGFTLPKWEVLVGGGNGTTGWQRITPRTTSLYYEIYIDSAWLATTDTIGVRVTDEAIPWDVTSFLNGQSGYGLGSASSILLNRAEGLWWKLQSKQAATSPVVVSSTNSWQNQTFVGNVTVATPNPVVSNRTMGSTLVTTTTTTLPSVAQYSVTGANTSLTTYYTEVDNQTWVNITTQTLGSLSISFTPAWGKSNYGSEVRLNKSWIASTLGSNGMPYVEWGHDGPTWRSVTVTDNGTYWGVQVPSFSTIGINQVANGQVDADIYSFNDGELVAQQNGGQPNDLIAATALTGQSALNDRSRFFRQRFIAEVTEYPTSVTVAFASGPNSPQACAGLNDPNNPSMLVLDVSILTDNSGTMGVEIANTTSAPIITHEPFNGGANTLTASTNMVGKQTMVAGQTYWLRVSFVSVCADELGVIPPQSSRDGIGDTWTSNDGTNWSDVYSYQIGFSLSGTSGNAITSTIGGTTMVLANWMNNATPAASTVPYGGNTVGVCFDSRTKSNTACGQRFSAGDNWVIAWTPTQSTNISRFEYAVVTMSAGSNGGTYYNCAGVGTTYDSWPSQRMTVYTNGSDPITANVVSTVAFGNSLGYSVYDEYPNEMMNVYSISPPLNVTAGMTYYFKWVTPDSSKTFCGLTTTGAPGDGHVYANTTGMGANLDVPYFRAWSGDYVPSSWVSILTCCNGTGQSGGPSASLSSYWGMNWTDTVSTPTGTSIGTNASFYSITGANNLTAGLRPVAFGTPIIIPSPTTYAAVQATLLPDTTKRFTPYLKWADGVNVYGGYHLANAVTRTIGASSEQDLFSYGSLPAAMTHPVVHLPVSSNSKGIVEAKQYGWAAYTDAGNGAVPTLAPGQFKYTPQDVWEAAQNTTVYTVGTVNGTNFNPGSSVGAGQSGGVRVTRVLPTYGMRSFNTTAICAYMTTADSGKSLTLGLSADVGTSELGSVVLNAPSSGSTYQWICSPLSVSVPTANLTYEKWFVYYKSGTATIEACSQANCGFLSYAGQLGTTSNDGTYGCTGVNTGCSPSSTQDLMLAAFDVPGVQQGAPISTNMTWGTQFNITVPGLVKSGDYIMAQGLILDVNNKAISGYVTNMTITNRDGSPLANNTGVGPSYNATSGDYLGIMTTNYIQPGNYYVTISFTDASNGVTAKESWPITIGNVYPVPVSIGSGGVGQVYGDAVIYYNFFDNNTGFGLNKDFYKFYVSPSPTIDESDRVVDGKVPAIVGDTYYFAVKDYFGHMVFPPADLTSYGCTGGQGDPCPFTSVTSSYAAFQVQKPQTFVDVGVTLYQMKIKNTQTDPAYVQMTANGKTYNSWVLPGEVVSMMLPRDTYSLSENIYDANLQPPQIVDYAYNYSGSASPYWMGTDIGDVGSLCASLGSGSCSSVPGSTGASNGVTGPGAACLDGDESTANYCGASPTSQSENLAYFGTLDLNRVAKLTNVRIHLWDGDSRVYYGFRVEVSADPYHNGWTALWDSTLNGCAGGGVATRSGTSVAGAVGGSCTSSNLDFKGLQTLSFNPMDVRYIRVFVTGNSVNTGSHLTEVLTGSGASASVLVNQDQFLWIRGYDIYSVVFAINNVNTQIYNQEVNVGVDINNQDSTILQQTTNIAAMFNNTNTWIGNQLIGLYSSVNNTNSSVMTQASLIRQNIDNFQSNITTQVNGVMQQIVNQNSNLTNQFNYVLQTVNNTGVQAPPDPATMAWYRLDEASGSAVMDSSPNQHNGVLPNGGTWTTGKWGGALALNGLNTYVDVSDPGSFFDPSNASAWTVEAWVKPNPTETTGGFVVSKPWNGAGEYAWRLSLDANLLPSVQLDGTAGGAESHQGCNWASALSTNAWHQLVGVMDSPNRAVMLYVDGALACSATLPANWAWQPLNPAQALSVAVGTLYPYGAGTGGFTSSYSIDGSIDQVRIVARPWSSDDVKTYYANVNPAVLNQFNVVNQAVTNTNSSITTQITGVSTQVSNLNSTVGTQFNAVEAQIVNQNSNLTNQFNYVSGVVNNTNVTLQSQLNMLQSLVTNDGVRPPVDGSYVGYWPLDDAAGSIARDHGPLGANLMVMNTSNGQAGVRGHNRLAGFGPVSSVVGQAASGAAFDPSSFEDVVPVAAGSYTNPAAQEAAIGNVPAGWWGTYAQANASGEVIADASAPDGGNVYHVHRPSVPSLAPGCGSAAACNWGGLLVGLYSQTGPQLWNMLGNAREGEQFTLSFRYKGTFTDQSPEVYICAQAGWCTFGGWSDNASTHLVLPYVPAGSYSTWQTYTATFTIPNGSSWMCNANDGHGSNCMRQLKIGFTYNSPSPGDDLYLDALQIEPGSVASAYTKSAWGAGRSGSSDLEFGPGDAAVAPLPVGSQPNLDQFTVALWVRPDFVWNDSKSHHALILQGPSNVRITKGAGDAPAQASMVNTLLLGQLDAASAACQVPAATAASLLPQGKWAHLATVVNGPAGTITGYINGQQVCQTTGLASSGNDRATSVLLGDDLGATTNGFGSWRGGIQDVRVVARAMSAGEIQAIAAGVNPMLLQQLNLLSQSVQNSNTSIQNQLNVMQTSLSNNQANISTQLNVVSAQIANSNSTIINQVNGVWSSVNNTNVTLQVQVNALSSQVANFNASMQTQINMLHSEVLNNGLHVPVEPSLLVYFPFDSPNGTTVPPDESMYQNQVLSNLNGQEWGPGKVGGAFYDDTTKYVRVPYNRNMDVGANGLSIEAWVKPDVGMLVQGSYPIVADRSNQFLLRIDTPSEGTKFSFFVWNSTAGTYENRVSSVTVPKVGVWYHVVGTYDNTSLKLYVNGTLEATLARSGIPNPTTDDFYVGGCCVWSGMWSGAVDEVRYYNRSLSASEVEAHYNNIAPAVLSQFNAIQANISNEQTVLGQQTNLIQSQIVNQNSNITNQFNAMSFQVVNNGIRPPADASLGAYYAFDDASPATTLVDGSTYANGATVTSPASPEFVTGKFAGALNLDGSAYASAPKTSANAPTGDVSVFLWERSVHNSNTWQNNMLANMWNGWSLEGYRSDLGSSRVAVWAGATPGETDVPYNKEVSDGAWHHVGFTYSASTGLVQTYVDGVATGSATAATGGLVYGTSPLMIGRLSGTNWKVTGGAIDELRVYNRVLSATEVQAIMNNLAPALMTQVNAISVNIANANQSILAQVNYVGLTVNNTNASIQTQVNGVWQSVNNTNASVLQQANAIESQIVNQNTNITNQYNSLSLTVKNSETNVTTQLNQVWYTVNSSSSNISTQVNTVQAQIVNSNTNISTQFNLLNVNLHNEETNITNQTNLLQVQIQNLNGSLGNQTNGIMLNITNMNASMMNQFNGVLVSISNSNLSIVNQTNFILSSLTNQLARNEGLDGSTRAYVPFDDVGASTARDLSGKGNDVVLHNGARVSPAGKVGGALDIYPTQRNYNTSNLVDWWTFDGNAPVNGSVSGGLITDAVAPGTVGTVVGGVVPVRGKFGNAIETVADSNLNPAGYVTVPNQAAGASWSLEVWVNPASDGIFVSAQRGVPYLGVSGGRFYGSWLDNASAQWTVTDPTVRAPNMGWYNVILAHGGTNTSLYVNGQLVAWDAVHESIMLNADTTFLGRFGGTTPGVAFNGAIDEVRIYNTALSAGDANWRALGSTSSTYGVGQYAQSSSNLSLTSGSISAEAWVKADAFDASIQSSYAPVWYIMSNDRDCCGTSGTWGGFAMYVDAATQPHARVWWGQNTEWTTVSAPVSLQPGVWYHVGFSYDESRLNLYLNGSLVASQVVAGGPKPYEPPNASAFPGTWTLGDLGCCAPIYPWQGYIDEAKVFDRALGATDFQAEATGVPLGIQEQINYLNSQVVNSNASISGQINVVNSNVNNTNASIVGQITSVSSQVTNSNTSILNQVNTVWGTLNNTNSNVGTQANLIRGDITNFNGNVTTQFNGMSGQISNLNTNVSTQINSVMVAVNNTNSTVVAQTTLSNTKIDNLNTNVSTQFNLQNLEVRNEETNITNQTTMLQVQIQNLNTNVTNQTNLVLFQVNTTNASILNQVNLLSQQVQNTNLSLDTQVNLVWSSLNNTNSSIGVQFSSVRGVIDFNNANINYSFAQAASNLSFVNSTILNNITQLNATLLAQIGSVLSDVDSKGSQALNQTQWIIANLTTGNAALNGSILQNALTVIDQVNNRSDQVFNEELSLLSNLTSQNANTSQQITNTTLSILSQVNFRSDDIVNRTLQILNNVAQANQTAVAQVLNATATLLGDAQSKHDDVINATLNLTENLTSVNATLFDAVLQNAIVIEQQTGANATSTLNNLSLVLQRVGYINNATISDYVVAILNNVTTQSTQVATDFQALRGDMQANFTGIVGRLGNATDELNATIVQINEGLGLNASLDIGVALQGVLDNLSRAAIMYLPQIQINDTTPPSSVVYASVSYETANAIVVRWASTDSQNFVAGVDVYGRIPGTNWTLLVQHGPSTGETVWPNARDGQDYEFKAIATDAAGNTEAEPANPGRNPVSITYHVPAGGFVPPTSTSEVYQNLAKKPFLTPGPGLAEILALAGVVALLAGMGRRKGGRKA